MIEKPTEVQLVFKGSSGVCLPTKEFNAAEWHAKTPAHIAILRAQAKRQCMELGAAVAP